MAFSQTKANIKSYVIQKNWYWYVPLWALGLYFFVSVLQFNMQGGIPLILLGPYAINFTVHEWAHIIAMFLPKVLVAAAGSASEILIGVILVLIAFKKRAYFFSLLGFLWIMLAMRNTALYMADSRAQQGDYVSLGGALSGSTETTHDWEFIFRTFGVLDYDVVIGNITSAAGFLIGLSGLVFGLWLMYRMSHASNAKLLTKKEEDLLLVASLQARKPKK